MFRKLGWIGAAAIGLLLVVMLAIPTVAQATGSGPVVITTSAKAGGAVGQYAAIATINGQTRQATFTLDVTPTQPQTLTLTSSRVAAEIIGHILPGQTGLVIKVPYTGTIWLSGGIIGTTPINDSGSYPLVMGKNANGTTTITPTVSSLAVVPGTVLTFAWAPQSDQFDFVWWLTYEREAILTDFQFAISPTSGISGTLVTATITATTSTSGYISGTLIFPLDQQGWTGQSINLNIWKELDAPATTSLSSSVVAQGASNNYQGGVKMHGAHGLLSLVAFRLTDAATDPVVTNLVAGSQQPDTLLDPSQSWEWRVPANFGVGKLAINGGFFSPDAGGDCGVTMRLVHGNNQSNVQVGFVNDGAGNCAVDQQFFYQQAVVGGDKVTFVVNNTATNHYAKFLLELTPLSVTYRAFLPVYIRGTVPPTPTPTPTPLAVKVINLEATAAEQFAEATFAVGQPVEIHIPAGGWASFQLNGGFLAYTKPPSREEVTIIVDGVTWTAPQWQVNGSNLTLAQQYAYSVGVHGGSVIKIVSNAGYLKLFVRLQ